MDSRQSSYKSALARYTAGDSMLENYIRARLTNRATLRLLLDAEELDREESAIAD